MNRIKEILKMKNIQQKELASHLDISPNTLSQYINEKRMMNPEILSQIADYLEVTVDYLICKAGTIVCPVCHNTYDPLNKCDSAEHDIFHAKFTAAENKFGTILVYGEADQKRSDCIDRFSNPALSLEEKENAFDDYLKYEYMLGIWQNNFDLSYDNFDVFCKKTLSSSNILNLLQSISTEFYNKMLNKYDVSYLADYYDNLEELSNMQFDLMADIETQQEKIYELMETCFDDNAIYVLQQYTYLWDEYQAMLLQYINKLVELQDADISDSLKDSERSRSLIHFKQMKSNKNLTNAAHQKENVSEEAKQNEEPQIQEKMQEEISKRKAMMSDTE